MIEDPSLKRAVFERYRESLFSVLRDLSYEYREKGFILKSGARSNHYVDCRQAALNSGGSHYIGILFLMLIEEFASDVVAIGGPSVGADPLVSATLAAAHNRFPQVANGFYVRPVPKDHGVMRGGYMIGGNVIPHDAPVAICDDVITSGGSMLDAVHVAQHHESNVAPQCSFDVRIALALVDRQEQDGLAKIQVEVPKVMSLFTLEELVSGIIQPFPHF